MRFILVLLFAIVVSAVFLLSPSVEEGMSNDHIQRMRRAKESDDEDLEEGLSGCKMCSRGML